MGLTSTKDQPTLEFPFEFQPRLVVGAFFFTTTTTYVVWEWLIGNSGELGHRGGEIVNCSCSIL
jgi:hypothetical protein